MTIILYFAGNDREWVLSSVLFKSNGFFSSFNVTIYLATAGVLCSLVLYQGELSHDDRPMP